MYILKKPEEKTGENICDLMYGVGIMMFVLKSLLNKV